MITGGTLLAVRIAAAILGAAGFLVLFVTSGLTGLPVPLNFVMPVVGALLGWYLPGMAEADRRTATRLQRHDR